MTTALIKKNNAVQRLFMALCLVAIVIVAFTLWRQSQARQGFEIQIRFPEGRGLKVGDPLDLNGVEAGHVRSVDLLEDLSGVSVTVGITGPRRIASEGSQFWIVGLDVDGMSVTGVETVFGPNYITVIPGSGPFTDHFEGLAQAPVQMAKGDAIYELISSVKPPVGRGSSVSWKGLHDGGVVLDTAPAADSSGVLTRVVIRERYVPLIREGTVFYAETPFRLEAGITRGISLETGSLRQILQGGLGFATPPAQQQGGAVEPMHRFTLAPEKRDEFDTWMPGIPLGDSGNAQSRNDGLSPLEVTLTWEAGRFRSSTHQRSGFAVPTATGILIPSDLSRPEKEWKKEFQLQVGGEFLRTDAEPLWTDGTLSLLPAESSLHSRAHMFRITAEVPKELLIYGPRDRPFSLSSTDVELKDGMWRVLPEGLDSSWHGAAVTDRATGELVGMLLSESGKAKIAPLPDTFPLN